MLHVIYYTVSGLWVDNIDFATLNTTNFPVLNWLSRTWHTETRSNNTTYTNSNDYPIDIIIIMSRVTNYSVVALLRVGADVRDRVNTNDTDNGTVYASMSATIPPGETYRLEATVGTIWRWSELY